MEVEIESQTKTQQLVAQLGWTTRETGSGDNLAIETCPLCANTNYKFFIHVGGDKDGLWDCKVCGQRGNFFQLRERLGIRSAGVASMREAMPQQAGPLPNADLLHKNLMEVDKFEEALNYLEIDRGFSRETIKKLKLGAEEYAGKLWVVYPYLDAAGRCVYYKARTIHDKKEFRAPAHREAMLFNETCLRPDMDELYVVEGEADCIALINQGVVNVVGIPGAGIKKAAWLEKLDRLAPKVIYLCYDTDKPGQDAARIMAGRIGIDKCKNLVLPAFEATGQDGKAKPGKDANEFFVSGRSLEEFRTLAANAKPFDVEGVQSVGDILDELEVSLEEKGAEPTYLTPWPALTRLLGGAEEGDVIGIMAEGKVGKTTMGLDWCQWFADRYDPSMLYCMEMMPPRLVRKWVSYVTETDDTPGKSQINAETVRTAKIIASQMPNDLLFGYGRSRKPDDVFETIRQAVRRYSVKLVCLDNLQLLIHGIRETAQETSKVMKQVKALAMELKIVVLLIIQPNRVAEGQIIAARNAMGSSAIEKDVDAMICLHRNRTAQIKASEFQGILETSENFEPQMLCRVDLSRYSPGGVTTLYMEGGISKIRELSQVEAAGGLIPRASGIIETEVVAV